MKKTLGILMLLILIPCLLFASGSAGANSGEALLVYPEAAINASGNAGAGLLKPNWQFIQLNPAYLSLLKNKTIGFSHNEYLESMSQKNISFINNYKDHRYYFGLNYFDYGDFDRTTYSSAGGSFSAKSYLVKCYLGTPKIGDVYTGVGLKFFNEKLESHSGNAVAIDLGALYLLKEYSVAIGVTLQNIGSQIKYQTKSEDLPLLVRLGASYYIFDERLGLFLDIEKIRNQDENIFIGAEYNLNNIFKIRCGLDGANDASRGFSLGFDLNLTNGIDINYAYIPYEYFDNSHKITFAYNFGKFPVAAHIKKENLTEKSTAVTTDKTIQPKITEKITRFIPVRKDIITIVSLEKNKISAEEDVNFIINNFDSNAVEIEICNTENFDDANILNYFVRADKYSVKLDYGKYFWRYRIIENTTNDISDWRTAPEFSVFKTVNLKFDRNESEIVIIEVYKSSDMKKPYHKQIIETDEFKIDIDDNRVEYYYTVKGFDKDGKRILYEKNKKLQ